MSNKNPISKTFGQLLRDARNEKGLTLRKFAAAVGLSPAFISKVERDEMNPPGEETIKRIATFLNLNEDELLAEAGKISSDLTAIILKEPKVFADFLRKAQSHSSDEIQNATKSLNHQNKSL